jgi:hypothetical protein
MIPIPCVIAHVRILLQCDRRDYYVGFFLFDHCSIFLQDADGCVPFYWGVDSVGHLVVSDDAEIVKNACGKSFAPFPKGMHRK